MSRSALAYQRQKLFYVIWAMLKLSIAINIVYSLFFASYFDGSVGKKNTFCEEHDISCVQETRICLLVNMVINTLNKNQFEPIKKLQC